jgi:hypothetical protein
LVAYAAMSGLRLPAPGLVAVGALVLDVAVALVAVSLVWGDDLPYCTRHPDAGTGVVLGFVTAGLGGIAFAGTLVATDRHPASAILAFVLLPLPYVVIAIAELPGSIC